MFVNYKLTPEEKEAAHAEAVRRQTVNERNNARGRNRAPERGREALNMHLCGAAGEMAVASYLSRKEHLFLDLEPVRGSCDLPLIDVKTRTKHYYELLCQVDDSDEKILTLVTIENREIHLHGWIESHEAKGFPVKSFRSGRPAHVVPQGALQPMSTLLVETLF